MNHEIYVKFLFESVVLFQIHSHNVYQNTSYIKEVRRILNSHPILSGWHDPLNVYKKVN